MDFAEMFMGKKILQRHITNYSKKWSFSKKQKEQQEERVRILRSKAMNVALPLSEKDEKIGELIFDYVKSGRKMPRKRFERSRGLAAPQICVPLRMFACKLPAHQVDGQLPKAEKKNFFMLLINPSFKVLDNGATNDGRESCLSIISIKAGKKKVKRYSRISVSGYCLQTGTDVSFKAWDVAARIIQHEMDHLDGILFLDR